MNILNLRRDNLRTCFIIVGTGLMTALVTLVLPATTQAATLTWLGGHVGSNSSRWTKPGNWDGAWASGVNTHAVFNAPGALQLTNRINGTFEAITPRSGPYQRAKLSKLHARKVTKLKTK